MLANLFLHALFRDLWLDALHNSTFSTVHLTNEPPEMPGISKPQNDPQEMILDLLTRRVTGDTIKESAMQGSCSVWCPTDERSRVDNPKVTYGLYLGPGV